MIEKYFGVLVREGAADYKIVNMLSVFNKISKGISDVELFEILYFWKASNSKRFFSL